MEATKPEQAIFSNQARLSGLKQKQQASHKTFHLQPVLPTKCAEAMVAQSL